MLRYDIKYVFGFLRFYHSDALTDPRAVMVKAFDTIVTNGTVRAAWGPVKHASVTVFDPNRNPVDHNFFGSREL